MLCHKNVGTKALQLLFCQHQPIIRSQSGPKTLSGYTHIQKTAAHRHHNCQYDCSPFFLQQKYPSAFLRRIEFIYICACLLTQLSSLCSPPHAFIISHNSAASRCVSKTSAQWHPEQSSFITVAGPCRIFTCFHLSSETARPASKNTESSIQFTS